VETKSAKKIGFLSFDAIKISASCSAMMCGLGLGGCGS
jgi:hypothetical protein